MRWQAHPLRALRAPGLCARATERPSRKQHDANDALVGVLSRGGRTLVARELRHVLGRNRRNVGLELDKHAVVDLDVDDPDGHDVVVDDLKVRDLPARRAVPVANGCT